MQAAREVRLLGQGKLDVLDGDVDGEVQKIIADTAERHSAFVDGDDPAARRPEPPATRLPPSSAPGSRAAVWASRGGGRGRSSNVSAPPRSAKFCRESQLVWLSVMPIYEGLELRPDLDDAARARIPVSLCAALPGGSTNCAGVVLLAMRAPRPSNMPLSLVPRLSTPASWPLRSRPGRRVAAEWGMVIPPPVARCTVAAPSAVPTWEPQPATARPCDRRRSTSPGQGRIHRVPGDAGGVARRGRVKVTCAVSCHVAAAGSEGGTSLASCAATSCHVVGPFIASCNTIFIRCINARRSQ